MSGAVLPGACMLATFGILASLKAGDLSIVIGVADADREGVWTAAHADSAPAGG